MISKMLLVPADTQSGGGNDSEVIPEPIELKKRIDRNPQKIQRLLKIVLKIAMNNTYTDNFEIKNKDGIPISDSNISDLLNSAISHQKPLVGEDEFIRILYESNVDPNLLINQNMRNKLINFRPRRILKTKPSINPDEIPIKRKRNENEDKNPWDIPLPDDGEDI